MTYAEILKKNAELKITLENIREFNILILSNIIVNQQKEILEYTLRNEGVNVTVDIGNYDNIFQDSSTVGKREAVLIFWEAANIIEGFAYRADLLSKEKMQDLMKKTQSQILSVLNNLKSIPLVVFNSFSSAPFTNENLGLNSFERFCTDLNLFITQNAPVNTIVADVNKVYSKLGIEKSVDFRYWYSSKSLYSIEFFKAYANFVKPSFLAITGKTKKALFLDCDNTLWKGIIGEDGLMGINLSSTSKNGTVYEEVQSLIASLAEKGIIIGLVSKNNAEDVDEVFMSHGDMVLKDEHIAIKRVNWEDKPGNVSAMAKQLNIGLDSCVFIDDSDFETDYMKEQNPEVSVFKVPSKIYQYPDLMRKINSLFFTLSKTKEDIERTNMYKSEQKRNEEKASFDSMEDYLTSLELIMTIYTDNITLAPRIAQMTQKTNQFNLTTKRYTESEIHDFIQSDKYMVSAFGLRDKFGDAGITGLCIIEFDNEKAKIDTFLMSCRVLGRHAEKAFMNEIINACKEKNIKKLTASYIKTPKNAQVSDFYQKSAFTATSKNESQTEYIMNVKEYFLNKINYIKIIYEKSN
ncbi:MAG: HAD-IIIC family phosphatase [Bacteroidota bacterium]